MVKTRRQIRTEEDRFGGYSNRALPEYDTEKNRFDIDNDNFGSVDEKPAYFADIAPATRRREQVSEEVKPAVNYSTRKEYESYPDTAEFIGAPTYRAGKSTRVYDAESLMPTIRTRKTLDVEKAPKERKASSVGAKTKAMLGVYLIVVAVLAAIVIATGITIGGMSASVASLEADLALKSNTVAMQNAELAALDNDTMVLGQAVELGMTRPTNLTQVELMPTVDPVTYEAKTNWFDIFCDWLSNLIGG